MIQKSVQAILNQSEFPPEFARPPSDLEIIADRAEEDVANLEDVPDSKE